MQVNRDDVIISIFKTDTAGFVRLTFSDGHQYEMTAWNAAAIGDLIAERAKEADKLYWNPKEEA